MRKKLFLLSFVVALLASCNNEVEINKPIKTFEPSAITINSFVPKMTKATDTNVDTLQDKGISVFTYKAGTSDIFMDDVTYSYDATDNYWVSSPIYYWPDYAIDFYACYPSVITKGTTTPNVFTYTVYPEGQDEVDVVMAFKGNQTAPASSNPLDMVFQHALSKISFVFEVKANSGLDLQIYTAQLIDIMSVGTFTYDTTAVAMPYFTVADQATTTNPVLNIGILEVKSSTTDVSSAVEGNLYLIPQSLTNWSVTQTDAIDMKGTYLELTATISGVTSYNGDIAIPITTTEWLPGYSYTYTIVFGGDGSTGGGGYNPNKPSPSNPDQPEQILMPINISATVEEWVDVSPEPVVDL